MKRRYKASQRRCELNRVPDRRSGAWPFYRFLIAGNDKSASGPSQNSGDTAAAHVLEAGFSGAWGPAWPWQSTKGT
jgi:hypothetical protein